MKKLFLCSIIFILFLTGCAKQNNTADESTNNMTSESNDIQSTDDMTAQQAFIEKDYMSLLNKYALQHEITDFTINEHQITLKGDIEVEYYWDR